MIEHRNDDDLKVLDATSVKYSGKPFPMRGHEDRVALVIEIDKVRFLKLPFEHKTAA